MSITKNAGEGIDPILLDVPITISGHQELLERVESYLLGASSQLTFSITTPNPEQLIAAQTDNRLHNVLSTSDIRLPDGIGIVWGLHKKYDKKISRLPGVDFMYQLIDRLGSRPSVSVWLVGGKRGSAERGALQLQTSYPNLHIHADEPAELSIVGNTLQQTAGANSIAYATYIDHLADRIARTSPAVVFIGLGAPKQEYLLDDLRTALSKKLQKLNVVLMSVGGGIDVLSGEQRRAPKFFQSAGLEWLWRLVTQPWRIRRQMALIQFAMSIWRE